MAYTEISHEENVRKLIGSILSQDCKRWDMIFQFLNSIDLLTDEERGIAKFFLTLKPYEQYEVRRSLVAMSYDVLSKSDSPDGSVKPKEPAERSGRRWPRRHPPVKSWPDGELLADSIHAFAEDHKPELKYTGMITAIDVLTACWSLEKNWYDFHYEIKAYRPDGVYVQRVPGRGHRTSAADTRGMR